MSTNTKTDVTSVPVPFGDPKVATMQEAYAAFGRGDFAAVLDHLTEEVDWAADPVSRSAPWYGNFRGKEGAMRFFEALGSTIEITDFTPMSFTSNDTDVMVVIRWSFTVRATGKTVNTTLHHWWRFVDGKIAWFRGAEDSEQTVAALR